MAIVWIAGCGDLGRATGRLLTEAGHRVLGLRRRPPGATGPFEYAAVDLADPVSLERLRGSPDLLAYMPAAPAASEAVYRETYQRGLENLLSLLAARGGRPERLLFVSSTAVYGEEGGAWVDEDTPCRPEGFRGRVMLAAERHVLALPEGRVARLSGIYGPGRTALVRRVLDGRPCRPDRYGNRIHRDDAARLVVHLLIGDTNERLLLGVDDAPAPECEVMDWIATGLGVPAPARDRDPASARGNKRCSNARLRGSGLELLYPSYREGYGPLLGEFR